MKTGSLLRVRHTPTYVRTTDAAFILRPKGGSNILYECTAGEVLMYLGECSPRNYYKVLCPVGIGWIFWVDIEVVETSAEEA